MREIRIKGGKMAVRQARAGSARARQQYKRTLKTLALTTLALPTVPMENISSRAAGQGRVMVARP
jgi:hypothetical protein